MLKSNISEVYSHKHPEIKINSEDILPFEKSLTIKNVVKRIESALLSLLL